MRASFDALQASVKEIVRRHEVLRTRIEQRDGIARQVVDPDLKFHIEEVDLRELADTLRPAEVDRVVRAEVTKPFDLRQGPLLRVTIIQLSERENLLHGRVSSRDAAGGGDGFPVALGLGDDLSNLLHVVSLDGVGVSV